MSAKVLDIYMRLIIVGAVLTQNCSMRLIVSLLVLTTLVHTVLHHACHPFFLTPRKRRECEEENDRTAEHERTDMHHHSVVLVKPTSYSGSNEENAAEVLFLLWS